MRLIETAIPDVKLIEPKVFGDPRGFFFESYNDKVFNEHLGIRENFVQDNHSYSQQNVLRGLHYQIRNPQGKLVRVTSGEVFDVAVDLRKSSPTFGKWVGVYLNEQNKQMLWIPPGFAHGFVVLSPTAHFLYKTTAFYDAEADRSILWNDSTLNIQWPLKESPLLSAKDQHGKTFKEAEVFP
jgi:dTDP-4-dehydrorhamnose 3,5-epimerase